MLSQYDDIDDCFHIAFHNRESPQHTVNFPNSSNRMLLTSRHVWSLGLGGANESVLASGMNPNLNNIVASNDRTIRQHRSSMFSSMSILLYDGTTRDYVSYSHVVPIAGNYAINKRNKTESVFFPGASFPSIIPVGEGLEKISFVGVRQRTMSILLRCTYLGLYFTIHFRRSTCFVWEIYSFVLSSSI